MHPDVRELTSEEEWTGAHPLMTQLRTDLTLEAFLEARPVMQAEGYRLLALYEDGAPRALAGIALLTNLYYGRHVWVYDLVTDESSRSRGHGRRLLGFVEALAREEGCTVAALASGLQRLRAHEFYREKMGYAAVSWNFRKDL